MGKDNMNFTVYIDDCYLNKTGVKHIAINVRNVLDEHGRREASKCLVKYFNTNKYDMNRVMQKNPNKPKPHDESPNLRYFLERASSTAKTKQSNNNKKNNRQQKTEKVDNDKTDMTFKEKKHFDALEFSETHTLRNKNAVQDRLEDIKLDDNYKLANPEEAQSILTCFDIHLIVNIMSMSILDFDLTVKEKRSIQALRLCRNFLSHCDEITTFGNLKNCVELLSEALYHLNPVEWPVMHSDIVKCFAEFEHKKLIKTLKSELRRNGPKMKVLPRDYEISFDKENPYTLKTTNDLCDFLCNKVGDDVSSPARLKITGDLRNGRTTALIDLYKYWAEKDSKISKTFPLVLPVFDFKNVSIEKQKSTYQSFEQCLQDCLRKWAPIFSSAHSFDIIYNMLKQNSKDILILLDSNIGELGIDFQWNSHCVETSRYENIRASEAYHNQSEPMVPVAKLLPLSKDTIREEIRTWEYSNIVMDLYEQFQDKKLLTCPSALFAFKRVVYNHKTNLEYNMMKQLVEEAHYHVHCEISKETIEEIEKLAFDHISHGNQSYSSEELPFIASYFVATTSGYFKFKSMFVEEYFAAEYVVKNVNCACWEWLKNPAAFKRVFKFVVLMWNEQHTYSKNEQHIRNYLSVLFKLYEYFPKKGKEKRPRFVPRLDDWTLEKEGYEKPKKLSFGQWAFLSHILCACDRDKKIVSIIRQLLEEFNTWHFHLNRFNELHAEDFSKIFKKLEVSQDYSVVDVKINGSAKDCNVLPSIIDALTPLKMIQSRLQITLYYDSKRPMLSRNEEENFSIQQHLKQSFRKLAEGTISVGSYEGPLLLPQMFSFCQAPAFNKLTKLVVTVYDEPTLKSVISSYPSSLEYLNLNIDPTIPVETRIGRHQELNPPPINDKCRIRIALRYNGDLQMLKILSVVPHIHVLKLHGIYEPDRSKPMLQNFKSIFPNIEECCKINASCLYIKFAHENYHSTINEVHELTWSYQMILYLTQYIQHTKRILLSRLPSQMSKTSLSFDTNVFKSTYFLHALLHKLNSLERFLIQDSPISLLETSQMLSVMEASEALRCRNNEENNWCCGDSKFNLNISRPCVEHCSSLLQDMDKSEVNLVLKERYPEETRNNLKINKPKGLELIIVNATDGCKIDHLHEENECHHDTEEFSKHEVDALNQFYFSNVPLFIQQVYSSKLVKVCYEGHRGHFKNVVTDDCDKGVPAKRRKHSGRIFSGKHLEIMKRPTNDLTIHIDYKDICDDTLINIRKKSFDADLTSEELHNLMPVMAVAQYLKLRVGHLSSRRFCDTFYGLLCAEKRKLMELPKNVEPFNFTVKALFNKPKYIKHHEDSQLDSKPHGKPKRFTSFKEYVKQQCDYLEGELNDKDFELLSSFCFEFASEDQQDKIIGFVKKSLKGKITNSFSRPT